MTVRPLAQLLAEGRPAQTVAMRDDVALSLGALRQDVAGAASRIRERRIRRGALICRDAYWFAVGLFALFAAGAEVVIPPSSRPGVLAELADSYDAVIADDPGLADLMLAPGGGAGGAVPSLASERCEFGIFTSGSTGQPKRVRKTLAQFEQEAALLERRWGQDLGAVPVIATVTHQHVYGLTFRLLWPLAAGRPFPATTYELWEDVMACMPARAVLVTSPTHLMRLAGFEPLPAERRPARIFTAGAPLPYAAARDAEQIFGALPTEIYGSTETGALATRQQDGERVPWHSLPGVEIAAADGRLRVRAPSVDPGNWFTTEDLIEPAGDGGFSLLGRADRIVKIEGKRVSLAEVEDLLRASALVADAAAVLLEGPPAVLAVAVVPSVAGQAELAARGAFRFSRLLRREVSVKLDPMALPRRWRFVAAIPSAAMGKRPPSAIAALFGEAGHG